MQPFNMTNMRKWGLMSSIILLLLVPGCSMVGPDFVKPEAPVENEWLDSADERLRTERADYRDWWTLFDDPILTSLVESAYRQNLPLQIAGLRILEARALLGGARAGRWRVRILVWSC